MCHPVGITRQHSGLAVQLSNSIGERCGKYLKHAAIGLRQFGLGEHIRVAAKTQQLSNQPQHNVCNLGGGG